MLTDTLHRSRLQFPGMAMGFLRRILDTAQEHCKAREVGSKSLLSYDQVKSRLNSLQSKYTVCSAMCAFSSKLADTKKDLSSEVVAANSVKALITDYMQEASQSLMQLMGAKGYKIDSVASRGIIDSRPFQIFEGSNDILYQQISEGILKGMRKLNIRNLYEYLSSYDLTKNAAPYFKKDLSFNVPSTVGQEKMVQMGKVVARIISMEFTMKLEGLSFNKDMIKNSLETVRIEVNEHLSSVKENFKANFIEEYSESRWQNCLKT